MTHEAKRVDKPWGYELWYADTELYAGKILHVDKGHRLSLQFHERKDETSYLLKGRLLLVKGPNQEDLTESVLEPGAAWRNHPGRFIPSRRSKTRMSSRSQPGPRRRRALVGLLGREGTSGP